MGTGTVRRRARCVVRRRETAKAEPVGWDWLDKSPEQWIGAMAWVQHLKRVFSIDSEIKDLYACKLKIIRNIEPQPQTPEGKKAAVDGVHSDIHYRLRTAP